MKRDMGAAPDRESTRGHHADRDVLLALRVWNAQVWNETRCRLGPLLPRTPTISVV
jgi:hypothetical protein